MGLSHDLRIEGTTYSALRGPSLSDFDTVTLKTCQGLASLEDDIKGEKWGSPKNAEKFTPYVHVFAILHVYVSSIHQMDSFAALQNRSPQKHGLI